MPIEPFFFESAVSNLIAELFDGPSDDFAFIFGRNDPGLLGTMKTIDAATASQPGPAGSHSIAGHVHHMWYCLDVLNRWADGDDSAFMTADWQGSWNLKQVDDAGWAEEVEQLRSAGQRWQQFAKQPRDWNAISLPGAIASVAHVAYHLAAIRQLAAFSRS